MTWKYFRFFLGEDLIKKGVIEGDLLQLMIDDAALLDPFFPPTASDLVTDGLLDTRFIDHSLRERWHTHHEPDYLATQCAQYQFCDIIVVYNSRSSKFYLRARIEIKFKTVGSSTAPWVMSAADAIASQLIAAHLAMGAAASQGGGAGADLREGGIEGGGAGAGLEDLIEGEEGGGAGARLGNVLQEHEMELVMAASLIEK